MTTGISLILVSVIGGFFGGYSPKANLNDALKWSSISGAIICLDLAAIKIITLGSKSYVDVTLADFETQFSKRSAIYIAVATLSINAVMFIAVMATVPDMDFWLFVPLVVSILGLWAAIKRSRNFSRLEYIANIFWIVLSLIAGSGYLIRGNFVDGMEMLTFSIPFIIIVISVRMSQSILLTYSNKKRAPGIKRPSNGRARMNELAREAASKMSRMDADAREAIFEILGVRR